MSAISCLKTSHGLAPLRRFRAYLRLPNRIDDEILNTMMPMLETNAETNGVPPMERMTLSAENIPYCMPEYPLIEPTWERRP
jgi:hypothetical protein